MVRCGPVMLQVKSDFGADGNVRNAVLAESYQEPGALLLCHHNTFDIREGTGDGGLTGGSLVGDTGVRREDGCWLFSVPEERVHVRIVDGKADAMPGWLMCERVRRKRGTLLSVESELVKNVVRVDGRLVVVMDNAAYRSWYVLDGKQVETWRVRERDVLVELTGEETENYE
jgi:hypothetical protein